MSIRNILVIAAVVALAGCKIEIRAQEGGRVVTDSGDYTCESGETCVIDVVDLFFDQNFVAEPAEGMMFTGWKKRPNSFCSGKNAKLKPCHLYTSLHEGFEPLMAVLADPEATYYLIAKFAEDDGSNSAASICEYHQSTPGGDFDVCHDAEGMNTATCSALGGSLASRSCSTGDPVGYCTTAEGALYYYEGTSRILEMGCGFSQGEWTEL